jgi:hypothetical protein
MLAGRNPYLSSPGSFQQLPPSSSFQGQATPPDAPQAPNPAANTTGLPYIPTPGNYRFRLPTWNPLSVRRSSLRR